MPSSFRSLLAATLILTLFAVTYWAALRWTSPPPTARPASAVAVAPPPTAPVAEVPPPAAPEPPTPEPRPIFSRGGPMNRRSRLLHRYVGTVGEQPATALLEWQNPDSVSGTFYLHRGGPAYRLDRPVPPAPRRWHQRGQVLELTQQIWTSGGFWLLHGRPGATLRATWHGGPGGRPQLVTMRESYAGAVRLALRTEWVRGREYCKDDRSILHSSVPEVRYEFLQLPSPAAVVPALRPLLSPGPAARHRRLLESGDYDCEYSYTVQVRLNDFELLGYQYDEFCSAVAGTSGGRIRNTLLDLVSGRQLNPEAQLLPHYETRLARLLAPHLLHDIAYHYINRDSTWHRAIGRYLGGARDTVAAVTRWFRDNTMPSAAEGLFTGAGLEIVDLRNDYVVGSYPRDTFTWFIPYRELRPLVRPGTPLARMLRARGLW